MNASPPPAESVPTAEKEGALAEHTEPAAAEPAAAAAEPAAAAAEPAAAAAEPVATEQGEQVTGGTSALRAQLAKERARKSVEHRWGRDRMTLTLSATVALLLVGWVLRVPFYRAVARQGGALSSWGVEKLVEERDPASFEIFLHQMGTAEGRELCGELVFLLAGRSSLPRALAEDEEAPERVSVPEDPDAIAEHCAALASALKAEEHAEIQLGALYTLNYLNSREWERWERSDELLVLASRLLAHEVDEHRRLAALALCTRSAPEGARPALVRAVNAGEPDPRVRAFAVEALSRLADASYQPVISAALEDEDQNVRAAARSGLERLGSVLTVEQLATLIRGAPGRRDAALQLLVDKSGKAATALLLELSEDPDTETRREALYGLARREGEGPRLALERGLVDFDPQVRMLAAVSLRDRPDGSQALGALSARMLSWSGDEPDTGWNELLELHRTLKGLTGNTEVPAPTPEPPSWRATQQGWAKAF